MALNYRKQKLFITIRFKLNNNVFDSRCLQDSDYLSKQINFTLKVRTITSLKAERDKSIINYNVQIERFPDA